MAGVPSFSSMRRTWLLFSQAVTVALALLFVLTTLKPQWLGARSALLPQPTLRIVEAPAGPAASASDAGAGQGYSAAASLAAPAVVSIVASQQAAAPNPHADDPTFRFFFGEAQPRAGLGSGVIVAPEGYLLTNHHVVAGADAIEVQLADGRRAPARLVGSDPETDLALLRLDLPDLPSVALGDAAGLRVGDIVLAIGNPFGVGQTVTAGIVSALGRTRLGLSTYENFIQTDAAINPGNSGGALIDGQGHLVGINTAIFSRQQGGGSLGIGFAIPVDTARQVLEALVRDGEVRRGWLGVEQRDLSPEFVEAFKLPITRGALITGVLQDGPASRAGVRPGDVVVHVGDRPVEDSRQLLAAVAALKPGATIALGVQRRDEALTLQVTPGQRPPLRR
jgi:serine protease DegQ